MRVMILEDDLLIADLLKQVVLSLQATSQIDCFSSAQDALNAWPLASYQLVIADWNLPDGTGFSLFERIRKDDQQIPLVMITGRADRASVLAIRRFNINDFISKPFQMPRLLECLRKLLSGIQPTSEPTAKEQAFLAYLADLGVEDLDLPLLSNVKEKLEMSLRGEHVDLRLMLASWRHDPALVAHLLAVANSRAYLVIGKPCLSLIDALQRIGGPLSLNLAIALALRQASIVINPYVKLLITDYLDQSERLSERVVALAEQCKLATAPLQTAALLHCLGELCVLFLAEAWASQGHELPENQVLQAVADYSQPFAVALKAHWNLPMSLRDLIGAVYALPSAQVRREQVVMRLAAAELAEEKPEDLERLRRLSGLT